MKVNCTTLAQLINISPKIILKDVKHDVKTMAKLKKVEIVDENSKGNLVRKLFNIRIFNFTLLCINIYCTRLLI